MDVFVVVEINFGMDELYHLNDFELNVIFIQDELVEDSFILQWTLM